MRARRHDYPNGCAAFELAAEGTKGAALGLARLNSEGREAMYEAARHLDEAARHLQSSADLARKAAVELREDAVRADPRVLWLFPPVGNPPGSPDGSGR